MRGLLFSVALGAVGVLGPSATVVLAPVGAAAAIAIVLRRHPSADPTPRPWHPPDAGGGIDWDAFDAARHGWATGRGGRTSRRRGR